VQQFVAFISSFANAAYTYKKRYTVSGSARIDEANLFGVKTNDRKKILWSAGGAWKIDQESFYHIKWLPLLKLRTTYGYSGNVPSFSVQSLATITYYSGNTNSSGLPYTALNNLPNPNLRWEQAGQTNLGLDFGLKNETLTGTVEVYQKKGTDLISSYNLDPTVGATSRMGNVGNMSGKGADITLASKNISTRNFQWNTRLLLSFNSDKITRYFVNPKYYQYYNPMPQLGRPVNSIYSYAWAGLDAAGNPQGYDTTGKVSTNYSQILSYTKPRNVVYNGPANPTRFGSFMNDFSYKNFTISASITYYGGYYFRAPSINYSTLYGSNMLSGGGDIDFDKRWQKPGDEATTHVPSMPALANLNSNRDYFYLNSSVLVQKADNLRLKDVSLSYNIAALSQGRTAVFSNFQVYGYFYANMLLWKANTLGVDPLYPAMKPDKTYTLGIRASFK
jgi:hypothetical protein